jgi:hypothetical protein
MSDQLSGFAKMLADAEARQHEELKRKQEYFNQPGYIWSLYFNSNSPYNAQTGHLAQVKGVKAVNGASELAAEYSQPFKAWVYDADAVVSKNASGFKLEYFMPATDMESEEAFPISEVGCLASRNGKTGLLYNDAEGNEVMLTRNQEVPEDYVPIMEYIFKAYLKTGFIPGSEKAWDPRANNVFKGVSATDLANKLKANSERFVKNQKIGLQGWRTAKNSTSNVAAMAAAVGTPTSDAPTTKTRRSSKSV